MPATRARRSGRCGDRAARSCAHARHRLAARLARGVRGGARGHRSGDRRPARGRLPALPSAVALASGGAGLSHGSTGKLRPRRLPRRSRCSRRRSSRPRRRRPSAVLARMEAARGNAEQCPALAQRALASDVEFGLRSASAHALAALGLLALGSRRPEEAIAPLETVERISRLGAVGEPWLLMSTPDLIEALAHAGQRGARARGAVATSRRKPRRSDGSRRWPLRALRGHPRRCRALAGRIRGGTRAPRSGADAVRACAHRALLRRAAAPSQEASRCARKAPERARSVRRTRCSPVVRARSGRAPRERGDGPAPFDSDRRADAAGACRRQARSSVARRIAKPRQRCSSVRRRSSFTSATSIASSACARAPSSCATSPRA